MQLTMLAEPSAGGKESEKLRDLDELNDLVYGALHSCVMCLRAIINQGVGLGRVLEHPNALLYIALCLASRNSCTRVLVLVVLTAVCVVERRDRVLSAFNGVKELLHESARFQTLVALFTSVQLPTDAADYEPSETTDEFQSCCIQLINVMVHNTDNLNERTALQHEFTALGLDAYLRVRSPHRFLAPCGGVPLVTSTARCARQ
jgi:hypothetical protein